MINILKNLTKSERFRRDYSKRPRTISSEHTLEKQNVNLTLLFNKPRNVVSSFTSDASHKHDTLSKYVNIPHVYACGRLDRTSEGLLVLSSSRHISSAITDPNHYIEKTYYVNVEGSLDEAKLERLRRGVCIDGNVQTQPCTVEIVDGLPQNINVPAIPKDKDPQCTWIKIRLKEGINRQIRKMIASLGHHTVRIVRTSVGSFSLNENLSPGESITATPQEISDFWKNFYYIKYKGSEKSN